MTPGEGRTKEERDHDQGEAGIKEGRVHDDRQGAIKEGAGVMIPGQRGPTAQAHQVDSM